MATDKELSSFIVNEVESDDELNKISQEQTLEPNQIFVTKDGIISDNAVGLPIGAIFASAIPITDSRVHLLDGSYISQTGVYEEFSTLIKNLVASGQNISCSETQFNEDVSKTGNCGKFVITSNGTIRLPKITTFIQGLSSITNIGSSLDAGLPNITGQYTQNYDWCTIYNGSSSGARFDGAFTKKATLSTNGYKNAYVSGGSGYDLAFDASLSNDIYGNSSTVQPNATQYPYYIVLASGYKSKKSLDVDNIMKEVNSKTTLDAVYPVGSIYLTMNAHGSPAKILGGTWEQIKDCFLWMTGDTTSITYTENGSSVTKSLLAGSSGGEFTHKLITSEMPSHNHGYRNSTSTYWSGTPYFLTQSGASGNADGTILSNTTSWAGVTSTGGSGTHNNMPPYFAVYAYKRVPDDETDVEVDNY